MVGYNFCEKLIAKSNAFNLAFFGEEPRVAYDHVHLSEYFGGKTADDLLMASTQWYHDNGIALHLGNAVQEIDRASQTVHARCGLVQPYNYLVLDTGSSAFVPDIPGVEKKSVMVSSTIEDLNEIEAYAATPAAGLC
jgi:nitrite reductase (NADH) large subunit